MIVKERSRIISTIVIVLAVFVIAAMYVRIYFGADYADEGFHVAMPYRFALGDRPFIDELSLQLGFGYVAAPLFRIYIALFETEGIVLFGRHMYWILTLLVAFSIGMALKSIIPWQFALAAVLLGVGFASANTPSLSYDNMGISFFMSGLFFGVRSLEEKAQRYWPILSGASHGLAAMSYFPLVLPVVAFTVILSLFLQKRRKVVLLLYILSGTIMALPLILSVWSSGVGAVYEGLARTRLSFGKHPAGLQKLVTLTKDLASCAKHSWWLAVIGIGVITAVRKKWHKMTLVLLALYPFALLPMYGFRPEEGYDSPVLGFALYYGFLSIFLIPCVWSNRPLRVAALIISIAALGSALTMGYASTGGYTRFAVGMLPIALLSAILSGVLAQEALRQGFTQPAPAIWIGVLCIIICTPPIVEVVFEYKWGLTSSLDRRLVSLDKFTAKIETGPFKGLYADEVAGRQFAALDADLKASALPGRQKALSVGIFSAGYLFMQLRPAAKMVLQPVMSDYDELERTGDMPDIILIWRTLGSERVDRGSRFIDQAIFRRTEEFVTRHPYEQTAARPDYEIYVLKKE